MTGDGKSSRALAAVKVPSAPWLSETWMVTLVPSRSVGWHSMALVPSSVPATLAVPMLHTMSLAPSCLKPDPSTVMAVAASDCADAGSSDEIWMAEMSYRKNSGSKLRRLGSFCWPLSRTVKSYITMPLALLNGESSARVRPGAAAGRGKVGRDADRFRLTHDRERRREGRQAASCWRDIGAQGLVKVDEAASEDADVKRDVGRSARRLDALHVGIVQCEAVVHIGVALAVEGHLQAHLCEEACGVGEGRLGALYSGLINEAA
eukprot:scaffold78420_cov57-Phaeocystis_antarctica.AAC.2